MNYQEARKFLSTVKNINYGGCLLSAWAIYKFCKQNNFEIPAIYCLEKKLFISDHIINRSYLRTKEGSPVSPSHVVWSFDGKTYYDAEEKVDMSEYPFILHLPEKEIDNFCKIALESGTWNKDFNRKKWLPEIEKNLGINLSTT